MDGGIYCEDLNIKGFWVGINSKTSWVPARISGSSEKINLN